MRIARRTGFVAGLLTLFLGATVLSADKKNTDIDAAKLKSTVKTQVTTTSAPSTLIQSENGLAVATAASPQAGEQIKWWVMGGGGGAANSTNFKLSGTIGQTAAGPIASTNFKLTQGFWQNFVTSCCVGTTGNVNATGIVDLSDLSALVNYLTGGGYVLPCIPEANVNNAGIVDLSDLSALVNYLTGGGYVLPSCP